MKSKRAQLKGNTAAMTIILIMLGGIVGYFAIVPAPWREGQLPDLPTAEYNNVILDATPGLIRPASERSSIKMIKLSGAIIDNSPAPESRYISDQLTITKSLIKSVHNDYDFSINTDMFSSARLHFAVSEKVGNGILTVRLNQHTVFSRAAGVGETLDIAFPRMYLHEEVNNIRISILGSDVWRTKSYGLTDVRLEIDNYPDTESTQHFSLTQNSAKSMETAKLTALIKTLGSRVNLEIALNDEQIFNAIPDADLTVALPSHLLNYGSNTITWSTDRGGKYSTKYAEVTVNELAVEEGAERYYFSVSKDDMYFANQPKKYDCELYLLKDHGADKITVTINSNAKIYSFEGGEVRDDICEKIHEGTNKITLSAEDDAEISKLKITIKNE